jgi:hypothetical protein
VFAFIHPCSGQLGSGFLPQTPAPFIVLAADADGAADVVAEAVAEAEADGMADALALGAALAVIEGAAEADVVVVALGIVSATGFLSSHAAPRSAATESDAKRTAESRGMVGP